MALSTEMSPVCKADRSCLGMWTVEAWEGRTEDSLVLLATPSTLWFSKCGPQTQLAAVAPGNLVEMQVRLTDPEPGEQALPGILLHAQD